MTTKLQLEGGELGKEPERLKERLKESYDAMAPKYNSWTEKHSLLRLLYLEKLFKLKPALDENDGNASILELGCGAGVPTLEGILSHYPIASVIGNDMSNTQIQLARQKLASFGDRVKFVEADMMTLAFKEASLDGVVAMYSLIHLPQSEQVEMLGKIAKWLKPGGYFLANFASEAMESAVFEHWLDEKGWMYWSGLGPKQTIACVEGTGLEIVHQSTEGDSEENFLWIIARK